MQTSIMHSEKPNILYLGGIQMASINDLIQQIENPELRNRIQSEVKKLAKQKKFGLVFEEHLPECTPLYDVPVTVGKNVSLKDGKANEIYKVVDIVNNEAICLKNGTGESLTFDIDKVVVTAVFGEPIYPHLKHIDSICNAPDSDLWHTLIEADNYHALQLLDYLYHGKVDCIYIDPPYNTGAKDWKYNNNYVDVNDEYRHSKWLSLMKKRLLLAKKLLNPDDSVLIVTIDEKEYLHLGCLLEEIFPEANIQMITSVISPRGAMRKDSFTRVEEYIFYIFLGCASITPFGPDMLQYTDYKSNEIKVWAQLIRGSTNGPRTKRPNLFYPIFFDNNTGRYVDIGEPLPLSMDRKEIIAPNNCFAVFPIRRDGLEESWALQPNTFKDKIKKGYIKFGVWKEGDRQRAVSHLQKGTISRIESGEIETFGKDEEGTIILGNTTKPKRPSSVWNMQTHDAGTNGKNLLTSILLNSSFIYPKSIYAVQDTLKFIVANKPNALILDFFAGSGTTLHAVNLINFEDGGQRRCIMVTNNEVSAEESKLLIKKGHSPGDLEWEKFGIARYITWPRTKCSILGVDINGKPLKGEYFTSLKRSIQIDRKVYQISFNSATLSFKAKKSIVSLMGKNTLPQSLVKEDTHYIVSEKYTTSIIFNLEYVDEWLAELEENTQVTDIYIVTDNDKAFKKLKAEVSELLGPIVTEEPVKLPMSEGFKANVEYFKLGFLDKTMVKIGRQFKELLPILWMKSGSVGSRPILENDTIPDMLVLPQNKMAILVDENKFYDFKEQVDQYPEIDYVYIVTNYEQGYRSKISQLNVPNTYQLYRDYLDNFRINYRRANQ